MIANPFTFNYGVKMSHAAECPIHRKQLKRFSAHLNGRLIGWIVQCQDCRYFIRINASGIIIEVGWDSAPAWPVVIKNNHPLFARASTKIKTARFASTNYYQDEWKEIEAGRQREAAQNEYLEIQCRHCRQANTQKTSCKFCGAPLITECEDHDFFYENETAYVCSCGTEKAKVILTPDP